MKTWLAVVHVLFFQPGYLGAPLLKAVVELMPSVIAALPQEVGVGRNFLR